MDFQQVGQLLRETREQKGLSIDDVVERTKISRRNVKAIEEGCRDDLPHAVYTKGFLKNYARFLGLDPEEVADSLSHELEAHDAAPERIGAHMTDLNPTVLDHVLRFLPALLLLAFLAAVVGSGVYFWPMLKDLVNSTVGPLFSPAPAVEAPAPQAPETPAVALPETARPTDGAQQPTGAPATESLPALPSLPEAPKAPTPAEGAKHGSADVPALAPSAAREPAAAKAAQAEASAPQAAPPKSEPAAPAAGRVLQLTATAPCWVSVQIDGSKKRDLYLSPGDSQEFRYTAGMLVKLGNAGGVRFSLDGKEVANDAKLGEVRSYSFE